MHTPVMCTSEIILCALSHVMREWEKCDPHLVNKKRVCGCDGNEWVSWWMSYCVCVCVCVCMNEWIWLQETWPAAGGGYREGSCPTLNPTGGGGWLPGGPGYGGGGAPVGHVIQHRHHVTHLDSNISNKEMNYSLNLVTKGVNMR